MTEPLIKTEIGTPSMSAQLTRPHTVGLSASYLARLRWLMRLRWLALVSVSASSTVAVLGLVPGINRPLVTLAVTLPDSAAPGGMVTRGEGIGLEIVRVRDGQADTQAGLIRAQAGDRIQYTITAESDGYIAVYNLQDDGTLQPYRTSEPIGKGQTTEHAVVLDDYAGSERIFFLLDDETARSQLVLRPDIASGFECSGIEAPLAMDRS